MTRAGTEQLLVVAKEEVTNDKDTTKKDIIGDDTNNNNDEKNKDNNTITTENGPVIAANHHHNNDNYKKKKKQKKKKKKETAKNNNNNNKSDVANHLYGIAPDSSELVYRSGIPTLRSSTHRVKFSLKNRKTQTTISEKLPPAIKKEDVFRYDTAEYDFYGTMRSLLERCQNDQLGYFRSSSSTTTTTTTTTTTKTTDTTTIRNDHNNNNNQQSNVVDDNNQNHNNHDHNSNDHHNHNKTTTTEASKTTIEKDHHDDSPSKDNDDSNENNELPVVDKHTNNHNDINQNSNNHHTNHGDDGNEDPAATNTHDGNSNPHRLERFVVPAPSVWRTVNGGCCEKAQELLSERVTADKDFLELFDRFVERVAVPYMKQRLLDAGVVIPNKNNDNNDDDTTMVFYCQRPPTVRLQPGPARAGVKPHADSEYGHQDGEMNFWVPLTSRQLTGVDLWCESSPGKNDYHPCVACYGDALAFHGSSCRHFVNRNSSEHTRISFDFRIGVEGFFDPYWQMKGTTHDHGRKEIRF